MATKHVHADLIKAWADGAEIEQRLLDGPWSPVNSPAWHSSFEYRIKDPYRELKEAAKDPNKEIRCNGSDWYDGTYWAFNLPPEDYEIRDKSDPYAELKAAAKDPTKQIRAGFGCWVDGGTHTWEWNYSVKDYEIRDKPKAKVKTWLWIYKDSNGKYWTTNEFFKEKPKNYYSTIITFIQPAYWSEMEVEE